MSDMAMLSEEPWAATGELYGLTVPATLHRDLTKPLDS